MIATASATRAACAGRRAALALVLCLGTLVWGCSRTTNLVGSRFAAGATGDGGVSGADAGPPTRDGAANMDSPEPIAGSSAAPTWGEGGVPMCGKQACACSDQQDDDGDGLRDAEDPECIGPADNDERSFATGAEKAGDRACQDCFFDGNAGGGNDGCRRAASCSTLGDASEGSGACRSCEVDARCVDRCRPLTPNGCDCFGCCAVQRTGVPPLHVMLTAGCSMATLGDEVACPRCVQAAECTNPCDACELCLGKGPAQLPAPCVAPIGDPTAPRNTCNDGEPICDGSHPCSANAYCQWGCCIPILF